MKKYEALMSDSSIEDPLKIYESQSSVNIILKWWSSPDPKSGLCIYTNDGKVFYQDDDNTRDRFPQRTPLRGNAGTGKEGEREAQSVHNV